LIAESHEIQPYPLPVHPFSGLQMTGVAHLSWLALHAFCADPPTSYSFTANASDSVGGANGTLVGNAAITNNMLLLPGGGTSANPQGYVSLPNGIVSNNASITVECWLIDTGGLTWAEAWCFRQQRRGPGQPPPAALLYFR